MSNARYFSIAYERISHHYTCSKHMFINPGRKRCYLALHFPYYKILISCASLIALSNTLITRNGRGALLISPIPLDKKHTRRSSTRQDLLWNFQGWAQSRSVNVQFRVPGHGRGYSTDLCNEVLGALCALMKDISACLQNGRLMGGASPAAQHGYWSHCMHHGSIQGIDRDLEGYRRVYNR